jgi:hypothetical protein
VIEFDAPMNASTLALWLMDYVEFSWGPYALYPTKGWIVDIQDNPSRGTISFKILTSISDSDVLVLDELTATFDLEVDESDNIVTHDYDEGGLA